MVQIAVDGALMERRGRDDYSQQVDVPVLNLGLSCGELIAWAPRVFPGRRKRTQIIGQAYADPPRATPAFVDFTRVM